MEKQTLNKKKGIKVPHTFVILFFLVMLVSILTWIVPAGEFQYESVDVGGTMRNVVVPNSYQPIPRSEANPAGIIDFFSSFHKGLISAAEVVMLIFLVNGAFYIVIASGAINAFLSKMLNTFKGKEKIIIPIFFIIFALAGSLFGMVSHWHGLIPVFVGLGIALGYDAIVGLSIVGMGSYMGFAAGITNPYNVVLGQTLAGVPLYSNSGFRVIAFLTFCAISILWILRYGAKIKEDPTNSYMYGIETGIEVDKSDFTSLKMTKRHTIILLVLIACLALILWGSLTQGWGIIQLTGVFVMMGVLAGIVAGWNADEIAEGFIAGFRGIVFGALVAGIAKATLVVMQEGMIIDTIINSMANVLMILPSWFSAQGMLVAQTLINFIIPSGSGQAATIIPIMAPIGDLVGVSREVVVLAFQFGDGLSNLLWPTCAVAIITGLAKVPLDKWWKFFVPLFGILFVVQMVFLSIAIVLGL